MGKKILRSAKYLLFFLIGVGLLYLAFRKVDLLKMWEELRNAQYSWVLITMGLGFLTFVSRGYRWLILIETMGYRSKPSNSVYSVTVGYLVNLALPRLGEFTRCTALNRVEKVPIGKLFGTILVERAIDVVILFILLILTILTNLETFGGFFYDVFGTKLGQTSDLIGYLIIFFALAVSSIVLVFRYRKRLMRYGLFFKAFSFYRSIAHGFRTVFSMERKGRFLMHTLFIWTMYFFMTYLCFFSFDATRSLTPDKGLFVMTAGGMGMAAPTQGGIGPYHFMVKNALSEALEVQESSAAAFAIVTHSSQLLMILLTGTLSLFMLYRAGIHKKLFPTEEERTLVEEDRL